MQNKKGRTDSIIAFAIIGLIVFIYKRTLVDLSHLHKYIEDSTMQILGNTNTRLTVLEEGNKHLTYRIDTMVTTQAIQHEENKSNIQELSKEMHELVVAYRRTRGSTS